MDCRSSATHGITAHDVLQQSVARATGSSATLPLCKGAHLDKTLRTVWPGWRQRALGKKKDARKTDEDLAAEVSELLGYEVIRSTVNHWWHARRTPTIDEFMALCEALGADPGELLFEVRVMHNAVTKSPAAARVVGSPADTPDYLKAQAQRLRQFKAKKRRAKLPR